MSASFIKLAEGFYVAPQITAVEVEQAKADGVSLIINNRPDGEEAGQPTGETIAAAAASAGLAYVAIPVGPMGINEAMLDAFARALAEHPGPVLAFCRTGTRSTIMRALHEARSGRDVDAIIEESREAGYDLSGRREMMLSLQE